jgi:glutathione S-transferase
VKKTSNQNKSQERDDNMLPIITTFAWVPPFARGFVRDIRARWACEEVGQPYEIVLVRNAKTPEHRCHQPFGQVPTYRDEDVEIFESGAIVLRIAERAGQLIPTDPAARIRAIQWVVAALNSVEPFVMAMAVNDIFEADREWSKARHAKVSEDLHGRLHDLEVALDDRQWIDGENFTVGDLMLISVLGGLRGSAHLDLFPKLAAYVERGEARPAHRKAMADQLALYAEERKDG